MKNLSGGFSERGKRFPKTPAEEQTGCTRKQQRCNQLSAGENKDHCNCDMIMTFNPVNPTLVPSTCQVSGTPVTISTLIEHCIELKCKICSKKHPKPGYHTGLVENACNIRLKSE